MCKNEAIASDEREIEFRNNGNSHVFIKLAVHSHCKKLTMIWWVLFAQKYREA